MGRKGEGKAVPVGRTSALAPRITRAIAGSEQGDTHLNRFERNRLWSAGWGSEAR